MESATESAPRHPTRGILRFASRALPQPSGATGVKPDSRSQADTHPQWQSARENPSEKIFQLTSRKSVRIASCMVPTTISRPQPQDPP